jgi:hypothetical protein
MVLASVTSWRAHPTLDDIRTALAGNLVAAPGTRIFEAVLDACRTTQAPR